MERLTTSRKWEEAKEDLRNELGYSHIWKRLNAIEDILGDDYDLDRLRELVEADREKRCVVLPCEVGRTVYMPFYDEIVKMRIGQFHINGYTSQRIWAEIDCDWAATKSVRWDLSFGKTVFLTREAAENALQRGD